MEVNTTTTTDPVNYYNKFNNFILNPIVFIIIINQQQHTILHIKDIK